jgi:dTDP-4-amino-4,6-dideoxygalactose transaminase
VDIVPFVDLATHHAPLRDDLRAALERVLTHGKYILGPEVEEFERSFAALVGAKYAIGVASGLDALRLAFEAVDIRPGDEVIVPGNTFIATALAVSSLGAVPVLVDHDPATFNIDVNRVREVITRKTKAIVPVHLYGQAADMAGVMAIAKEFGLRVIEDACQAHGARYDGKGCGSIGDLGCFSFYPGKNLGGFGDGGLVTTNDEALARAVRQRRSYGEAKKYHHVEKGVNTRLDTMQAALLNVKLPRLDASNDGRRHAARMYDERLGRIAAVTPPAAPADALSHVYHLYVIRTPRRDELQEFLNAKGIQTGIHYPIPIHRQEAYRELASSAQRLPHTEAFAPQILSLPMFPELTERQVDRVCDAIARFHAG